jgi:hypothetical protein
LASLVCLLRCALWLYRVGLGLNLVLGFASHRAVWQRPQRAQRNRRAGIGRQSHVGSSLSDSSFEFTALTPQLGRSHSPRWSGYYISPSWTGRPRETCLSGRPEETISLALGEGFTMLRCVNAASAQTSNRRNGVSWTWLALSQP